MSFLNFLLEVIACLKEKKIKRKEKKKSLPFSRAISSSVSKSSFVEATVLLVTNLMYRLKERLFSLPSTRPSIRFFSLFSPFQCKKNIKWRLKKDKNRAKKNGSRREFNSWNISDFVCIDSKNELDLARKWEKKFSFFLCLLLTLEFLLLLFLSSLTRQFRV